MGLRSAACYHHTMTRDAGDIGTCAPALTGPGSTAQEWVLLLTFRHFNTQCLALLKIPPAPVLCCPPAAARLRHCGELLLCHTAPPTRPLWWLAGMGAGSKRAVCSKLPPSARPSGQPHTLCCAPGGALCIAAAKVGAAAAVRCGSAAESREGADQPWCDSWPAAGRLPVLGIVNVRGRARDRSRWIIACRYSSREGGWPSRQASP
jgi:hypothetical protein